jgi:hypothetical protein
VEDKVERVWKESIFALKYLCRRKVREDKWKARFAAEK